MKICDVQEKGSLVKEGFSKLGEEKNK